MNDMEVRTFQVDYRKSDSSGGNVEGYATITNSITDLGSFQERYEPGAFKNAINVSDTKALLNHDANHLLASTRSGTLTIWEDDKGLGYKFNLPKSRPDIKEMLERGDLDQSSFAFTVKEEEWRSEGGRDVRVISEIDKLYDISMVTYPANPDTTVALRSLGVFKGKPRPGNPTPTPGQGKEDLEERELLSEELQAIMDKGFIIDEVKFRNNRNNPRENPREDSKIKDDNKQLAIERKSRLIELGLI